MPHVYGVYMTMQHRKATCRNFQMVTLVPAFMVWDLGLGVLG